MKFTVTLLSLLLSLTFAMQANGSSQSNASSAGVQSDQPITIAEARQQPMGAQVTVAGWVTVTDEFRGPVYFQDDTAGIAWYNGPLMRTGDFDIDVAHGDSLVVTGTLGEFANTPGQTGDGLLQIIDEVSYQVYPAGNRDIEPLVISIAELNSGAFQGQLVRIPDVTIDHQGEFRGNINYDMIDSSADGVFRVDARSGVPKTLAPVQQADVTGVAGVFRGTAQLLPRNSRDANSLPIPGEDIPYSETFDIVTWNIEWFGDPDRGPSDLQLQFDNVKLAIETMDADLYTFQEIASVASWNQLANQLEDYTGILAQYSQTQKTAYLYRNDTIHAKGSGLQSAGMDSFDWASRLPLWLNFEVTIGTETRDVHAYGVHSKAFSDPASYQRRVNASAQLKSYLDTNRTGENIIFWGDFNDKLDGSTLGGGNPSPYENFVEDPNYFPVTLSLEQAGASSFRFVDMIDHIIVGGQLMDDHLDGSQYVVNASEFITAFENTTSDHYPVRTRFDLQNLVSVEEPVDELPQTVTLAQNYPNPFNPTTNISFELPQSQQVSLTVYDVTGRQVANLISAETRSQGTHTVVFDAANLATGVYLYRLSLGTGEALTNKMMLIK